MKFSDWMWILYRGYGERGLRGLASTTAPRPWVNKAELVSDTPYMPEQDDIELGFGKCSRVGYMNGNRSKDTNRAVLVRVVKREEAQTFGLASLLKWPIMEASTIGMRRLH